MEPQNGTYYRILERGSPSAALCDNVARSGELEAGAACFGCDESRGGESFIKYPIYE
jgi:hypothetical protein